MNRLLVSFFTILVILAALTPASSEKYGIEVVKPPTRTPPIKVYWDNSSMANCPRELSETIFETVKVAMIMLRKSIYRFAEESDGAYDDLIRIRFENVSKPERAHILIRVSQLGENVAGRVTYQFMDGEPRPPYILEMDCETPLSGTVPAFNIALHELLHALGLRHTKHYIMPDGSLEIMAEVKPVEREPTIYVSTLDLYALYRIYFTGHHFWGGVKDVVDIDSEKFSYRQVTPYVVEFQKLSEKYDQLLAKYSSLEERFGSLSRDVELVMIEVKSIEGSIKDIGGKVEEVSSRVGEVSEMLMEEKIKREALERSLREDISMITASIERLREAGEEASRKIRELSEENIRLSRELELAYREIDILRSQGILLIAIAFTALAIAVVEIPLIVRSMEKKSGVRSEAS
jgi:uncharacterized protein YoxC